MAPISSMTGFGRGEAEDAGVKVTFELSSVNRKQFECHLSLPRELNTLEAKLHTLLHSRIRRGHLKGGLYVAAAPGSNSSRLRIDYDLAAAQLAELRQAAVRLKLPDNLALTDLLCLPDVISNTALPLEPQSLWPLVSLAATKALEGLLLMRQREGRALARDLRQRRRRLVTLQQQIARRAPQVPLAYRDLLQARLKRFDIAVAGLEPESLARELALFADRSDISEELTRLASHLTQVEQLLQTGESIGRELDFLCQELLREINTIGSKANDSRLATLVITFKAELEALREQVQNVE